MLANTAMEKKIEIRDSSLQGIYAISYAHDWQGLSYLHIITVMTSKELIVISTNMYLTILKRKHEYMTKLHKKICTVIML